MKLTNKMLTQLIKESYESFIRAQKEMYAEPSYSTAQDQVDAASGTGDDEVLERIFGLANEISASATALSKTHAREAIAMAVSNILKFVQEMQEEDETIKAENR